MDGVGLCEIATGRDNGGKRRLSVRVCEATAAERDDWWGPSSRKPLYCNLDDPCGGCFAPSHIILRRGSCEIDEFAVRKVGGVGEEVVADVEELVTYGRGGHCGRLKVRVGWDGMKL